MTPTTQWTRTAHLAPSELLATLSDGRTVIVNTQYRAVLPCGGHIPTVLSVCAWGAGDEGCPQLTQMGGRCTCPANADIMALSEALLTEARLVGWPTVRTASEMVPATSAPTIPASVPPRGDGWCERCGSYCYGDCTAPTTRGY